MISEEFDALFPDKEHEILVGVSGGPDSLTLLHLLLEKGYTLVAAHFNHRLRPDAEKEARFVKRIADSWEIPCLVGEKNVDRYAEDKGLSIEEAARRLRYTFLFSRAEKRGSQAVAIGHNADDQVETVLMHIIRGTGVQGLAGMAEYSLPHEWSETIPLVRPLLSVWQEEIETYCQEHQLKPVIDPSNKQLTYFRNRIRHQLLPSLETYNPNIREALWQMAEILSEEYVLWEERTQSLYRKTLSDVGEGYIAFSLESMRELATADQRRLIRKSLLELQPDLDQVDFAHVERARSLLSQPTRSGKDHVVGKTGARIRGEMYYVYRWNTDLPLVDFPQFPEGAPLSFPAPGRFDAGEGWELSLRVIRDVNAYWERIMINKDPYQAWFDRDKIQFPLTLSGRKRGERFSPLGMGEERVKVSDLMINEKIPAGARDRWPILRSHGRILWVPGCRIAHFARVREGTDSVLRVNLEGALATP